MPDTQTSTPPKRPCPNVGHMPCPTCGEDAAFLVNLVNLDGENGDGAFQCCSCDAEFSYLLMTDVVRKWQRLLAWVAAAPCLIDEE